MKLLLFVRHLRSRRALSSIISGAILLTATALMGTGLVSWSNLNLSAYETSLSNTYSTNVNKLNENLVIENVWFNSAPSKFLNVTISNIGNIGASVIDIKIIDSGKITDFPFNHSNIVSNHQNSTLLSYNWKSGTPIQLVVTTARGSIYTSQVMSP